MITNKEKFKIRFIDHIYLAGKQEASRIFEIFDMDGPSIIQKKEQIRSDFDKGFKSYENKKFEEALGFFENCLKIFPEDAATNIFITRLKKLITNPPAEDWSPIFRFSQKDAI
jgi:hypothetical protein